MQLDLLPFFSDFNDKFFYFALSIFLFLSRWAINQFGIYCDENEYKLALVGLTNNIGGLLFMPLAGFLSDKYVKRLLLSHIHVTNRNQHFHSGLDV